MTEEGERTDGNAVPVRLSGGRRRLFERWLRQRRIGAERARHRLVPRADRRTAPLSFNQEALWFLDRMAAGNAHYGVPGTVRLRGSLDVEALDESLRRIVARHEALRTTFEQGTDGPRQVIGEPPATLLSPEPVEGPEADRLRRAVDIATREARRSFDLVCGPLFRCRLLRLEAEDHVLLFNVHHIVADGWSVGIFANELTRLYGHLTVGRPSGLPEPAFQFGDYALWQRQHLRGERLDELLAYWRERLVGAPARLELVTDHSRPGRPSYRGDHVPLRIAPEISQAVTALARRYRVSVYAVLLSAFKVLLHSYTDQTDIVVGSTLANRPRPELEGVVGHFANTMPLRSDLSGDPRLGEIVEGVHTGVLGAQAHQELPFPLLVKHLQIPRRPDRNPLYQVVFDSLTPDRNPAVFGYGMSSPVGETLELHRLTATPMDVESGVSRFDLAAFVWHTGGDLVGTLEYSTDLFERSSVERLVDDFEWTLSRLVRHPEQRVGEVAGALADSRRQRLRDRTAEKMGDAMKRGRRTPVDSGTTRC